VAMGATSGVTEQRIEVIGRTTRSEVLASITGQMDEIM